MALDSFTLSQYDFTPGPYAFRKLFVAWYNAKVSDADVPEISEEDTYTVWYAHTLGNAKTLVSTTRLDHMYYELTYDKDKDCVYVDQYLKVKHSDITRE